MVVSGGHQHFPRINSVSERTQNTQTAKSPTHAETNYSMRSSFWSRALTVLYMNIGRFNDGSFVIAGTYRLFPFILQICRVKPDLTLNDKPAVKAGHVFVFYLKKEVRRSKTIARNGEYRSCRQAGNVKCWWGRRKRKAPQRHVWGGATKREEARRREGGQRDPPLDLWKLPSGAAWPARAAKANMSLSQRTQAALLANAAAWLWVPLLERDQ